MSSTITNAISTQGRAHTGPDDMETSFLSEDPGKPFYIPTLAHALLLPFWVKDRANVQFQATT